VGRAATIFFSLDARRDFRELGRDLCRDPGMQVTLQHLGPGNLAKRAGIRVPAAGR
jgi:hypothetical protein